MQRNLKKSLEKEENSSFANKLFFDHASQLLKESPKEIEMWDLGEEDQSSTQTSRLSQMWDSQIVESFSSLSSNNQNCLMKKRGKSPSLWKVIGFFLGNRYLLAIFWLILSILATVFNLWAFPHIVVYVHYGSTQSSVFRTLVLTLLSGFGLLIQALAKSQYLYRITRISLHLKAALSGLVYSKLLRMSHYDKNDDYNTSEVDQISMLYSQFITDSLLQIERAVLYFPLFLASIILSILTMSYLWSIVGASSLFGLTVLLLSHSLYLISFSSLQQPLQSFNLLNVRFNTIIYQVFQNLKSLQFLSLLTPYQLLFQNLQDEQTILLHSLTTSQTIAHFLWLSSSLASTIACLFLTTLVSGFNLSIEIIFTTFIVFNSLSWFLTFVPLTISQFPKTSRAIFKLTIFLIQDELDNFHSSSIYSVIRQQFYSFINSKIEQKNENDLESSQLSELFNNPDQQFLIHSDTSSSSSSPSTLDQINLFSFSSPSKVVQNTSKFLGTTNQNVVEMNNCDFEWNSVFNLFESQSTIQSESTSQSYKPSSSKSLFKLRNIDLQVKRGQFVLVVGNLGSGKSSLLKAICGEMKLTQGKSEVSRNLSLTPQNPWIINETVMFNISFSHSPSDPELYKQALIISGVQKDLINYPEEDQCWIGDNPVSHILTTGQKLRICLARSLYSNSDLIIVDDIFSSFEDTNCAHQVFKSILSSSSQTKIVSTLQEFALPYADLIVHMDHGKISYVDSYQNLITNETQMLESIKLACRLQAFFQKQTTPFLKSKNLMTLHDNDSIQVYESYFMEPIYSSQIEQLSETNKVDCINEVDMIDNEEFIANNFFQKEIPFLNRVNLYFKNIGYKWFILLIVLSVELQILNSLFYFVVAIYCEHFSDAYTIVGLVIYVTIPMVLFLLLALNSFLAFRLLNSPKIQSNQIFQLIFSSKNGLDLCLETYKNVENQSTQLALIGRQLLFALSQIISAFIIIIVASPLSILTIGLGIYFCLKLKNVFDICNSFLSTTINYEKKSLRTQLFETIEGLSSIRAYKLQTLFSIEWASRMDAFTQTQLASSILKRYFALRLSFFLIAIITSAMLFGIFLSIFGWMNPILFSLAISLSLSLPDIFSSLLNIYTIFNFHLTSYSNLQHFLHNPIQHFQKRPFQNNLRQIALHFYHVTYVDHLHNFIQDFTLSITEDNNNNQSCRLLCIVGSGNKNKSFTLDCLLDYNCISSGNIFLNGVDISTMDFDTLHALVCFVPELPPLLSISIISYMDPFGISNDSLLWDSFRLVGIYDKIVEETGADLNFHVDNLFTKLNSTEYLLFNLARSICISSKIIYLNFTDYSNLDLDKILQVLNNSSFNQKICIFISNRFIDVFEKFHTLVLLEDGKIIKIGIPPKKSLQHSTLIEI